MEDKELKQPEEVKKNRRAKKDKLMFAGAVVVIIIISVLTSNVNLPQELNAFVKKIWNDGQDAVTESSEVETLAKGGHVEIDSTQVVHLREIYEVLGDEKDEYQAIEMIKEIKTLAYHAGKQGIAASSKEIEECRTTLEEKMKDADEAAYNRVVKRYGDEDDYWTVLEDEISEYVIAEKLKEEKREELSKKKDTDVEAGLQEYIDEIVGYENFKEEK